MATRTKETIERILQRQAEERRAREEAMLREVLWISDSDLEAIKASPLRNVIVSIVETLKGKADEPPTY